MIVRRKTHWIVALLVATGCASTSFGQTQTRDGAILGGVAGAVIGGVVGHHNHETGEGALLGGAVGAIAGGVIGNQREQAARQQMYQPQQYYYAQPVYSQPIHSHTVYTQPVYVQPVYRPVRTQPVVRVPARRPVTMAEVINMTRSNVSDNVIVAHIQANGVATRPDVNDVILLSQEGVSEFVITTMQTVGTPTTPVTVYPSATPVYKSYQSVPVVEERYVPTARVVERRGF